MHPLHTYMYIHKPKTHTQIETKHCQYETLDATCEQREEVNLGKEHRSKAIPVKNKDDCGGRTTTVLTEDHEYKAASREGKVTKPVFWVTPFNRKRNQYQRHTAHETFKTMDFSSLEDSKDILLNIT